MKTFFNISILFVVCLITSSCKHIEKEAGCEVNGVWLGRWQIEGGSAGTFITPVYQDETDFDGDIYIRFDLPSLENHGVEFSGKIREREARAMIEISGVEITAKGDVINDSLVSGTFQVSLGYAGTFDGRKIALQEVNTTEIYRINNSFSLFSSLLYVNDNLWLPDRSADRIQVIDKEGLIKRTIQGNFLGNVSTFDGEYFWTYKYDSDFGNYRILRYDTLGTMIDGRLVSTSFVDALAIHNSAIYYADNYYRQVYIIDQAGAMLDNIPALYNNISSFVFSDENIIYSDLFSAVLYKLNSSGEFISAYQLPFDLVRCITSDGNGSFWCLSEEYIESTNAPTGFNYLIHHFTVD